MQEDDSGDKSNFTAIWVLSPKDRTFKVFKEFDMVKSKTDDANSLWEPAPGSSTEDYRKVVWETELVLNN